MKKSAEKGKSLAEMQKARQESRSLRDVAYMYGSALKDQDALVKHYGAGWILPKHGFGAVDADGKPAHPPGTMRVVYPYPVLANDKAESFARCGLTTNDLTNNHIVVFPQQRLWRKPTGFKNDVERQVEVKGLSAKPLYYQKPRKEQYILTRPEQSDRISAPEPPNQQAPWKQRSGGDGRQLSLDLPGMLFQFGIPLKEVREARVFRQRQKKTPGNHPLGNTEPGACFAKGLRRRRRVWDAIEKKWLDED